MALEKRAITRGIDMAEQGGVVIPTWVLGLVVVLIGLTSAGVKYGCDRPAPPQNPPTKPIFDRQFPDSVSRPARVPTARADRSGP